MNNIQIFQIFTALDRCSDIAHQQCGLMVWRVAYTWNTCLQQEICRQCVSCFAFHLFTLSQ